MLPPAVQPCRLILSFVASYIAIVVRPAGRYLSIFVEGTTMRSSSSFRDRREAMLPPAVQPSLLAPGFVSSHIANVVRQAGRYLSIFMEDITT